MTKLIIGLGNIGDQYTHTRHNIGFLVVDALAKSLGEKWKSKLRLKANIIKTRIGDDRIILAKPNTFMNRSGIAAAALTRRFAPDQIIVFYDEADLPLGKIKEKVGGGSAGHNGIKSLNERIGIEGYTRIRVGIDRPKHKGRPLDSWVLGTWSPEEQAQLPNVIQDALTHI